MRVGEFYSRGKLLLTGEYVVLDGAEALALPCKLGQSLSVKKSSGKEYTWTSYLNNGTLWQNVNFSLEDILENKFETDFEKRLFQILKMVYDLKPNAFEEVYDFTTQLEFDKDWGLGSSSTLIHNIAEWASIDAYELLNKTFGGSGYDIAAASKQSPFIYKRLDGKIYTEAVEISESIKPHLFFVYLNQKQNSRKAIKNYRKINQAKRSDAIIKINEITHNMIKVKDLNSFETLLESHENLISELLNVTKVHGDKFKDYKAGIVKSLGAWGGDFVLVTAGNKKDISFFKEKNYNVIFNYNDLVF